MVMVDEDGDGDDDRKTFLVSILFWLNIKVRLILRGKTKGNRKIQIYFSSKVV
jgi:hypothetical protein